MYAFEQLAREGPSSSRHLHNAKYLTSVVDDQCSYVSGEMGCSTQNFLQLIQSQPTTRASRHLQPVPGSPIVILEKICFFADGREESLFRRARLDGYHQDVVPAADQDGFTRV